MITAILFFIYWPISYLYFEISNEESFKFKKKYILYFIPFLYYLVDWFSFFIKSGNEKLKFITIQNPVSSNIISRIISYIFMLSFLFLMIKAYKKLNNKDHLSKSFLVFNLILSFLSLSYYIIFILIYRLNINIPNIIGFVSYQLIFILPIFLFLSIYIKKIHTYIKKETPNVLDNNIIIEEETAEETQNIISENDTEKYKMNKISEDDATEYLEKIIKFVEENESYKDNSFNLTKLSNELNIPSAYISQALNIYKGETFYNFLNKYRIEIAKKMLIDPKYKNKTILAIAYESGFNSKATFNIFFKKIVGMTPSAYRNKN